MLGGLAVVHGDRRISRFQTQKTGALLAFLALHSSKSHGRESLAEMLWPEGDPLAIRNRLNQAISSLRRQLHPPELGPGTVLVSDHHSVGVNSQSVVSDVEEFEKHLRLAENAANEDERIKFLESAVALYKGELLEGYYEDWVFSRRIYLADLHDRALHQLIRSHVAKGDPEAAIEFARQRLAIDPYDEAHHVILMRLYMRAGRPKSALKQFDDLVRALQSFDDEPSETALKFRQKAELMMEDKSAVEDFDEAFADTPTRRPVEAPIPAKEEIESNLPRVVSSFVGRERELETISDQLKSGKSRLVTILGLGGCGKTRLAIEAGWMQLGDFGGKIFFVPLATLKDPDGLISEIARTLLPGKADLADPFGAVCSLLNDLSRCLLILDNFDHIAESVSDVRLIELMAQVPGLSAMVTSRVPLNVEGEHQVPLSPLPVPADSGGELRELATNPAIALFVDRAQVVKSDFQLTERTADAIVQLSRKLEGLPLALELAAGWARVLTPAQMLEQLDQNVDRLESRKRDANPRHRSLRAAFKGSFQLLDEDLRRVLMCLTIFAGGWDYAAASNLCPEDDLVACMQALEERSLIHSEPSDEAVRFGMLDTIRTFGKELMEREAREQLRLDHARYFLKLAESRLPDAEWIQEIERNYANCVAAMHRLKNSGRSEELARLALAVSRYWDTRGMLTEGKEWLCQLVDVEIEPLTQARVLSAIGRLEWVGGDFEAAVERTQQALETFEAHHAVRDQILAQLILHHEAHRRGDYAESRRLLDSNLKLSQSIGDLLAESRSWLALGNAAIEEERFEEAQANYERSLESGRKGGAPEMIGAALTNLANLAVYRGQTESAEKWIEESISQFKESRWKWYRAMNLLVKGRIENEAGKYRDAARSLIEAYRIAPDEKLVVWRFVMLFSLTLFGLGLPKDGARFAGFLSRYRERVGERHHGIEMRHFESRLEKFKSEIPPDQYKEQMEIGRNMALSEIDGTIGKVRRGFLSDV